MEWIDMENGNGREFPMGWIDMENGKSGMELKW